MIFLAKMTRIVQEHLIKLPHCSGWCLNVLVINRMVFSPLPTRRMSAHSITSPITWGNRIRKYYEYVSSRILSTRKRKKGGWSIWKIYFSGAFQLKRSSSKLALIWCRPKETVGLVPISFYSTSNTSSPPAPGWFIGSQQWRVMFWVLGTNIYIFLLVRHFQAAKELRPTEKTRCCKSFNRNTNKITNSNGNINTNVNTNSNTVEYESETGGIGWWQTGCGNALKVSLSILGNFFSEFWQLSSSTSSPVLKLGSGLSSGLTRLITRWQRCGHVREATGANQNWSTPGYCSILWARTHGAMTGTKTLIWTK